MEVAARVVLQPILLHIAQGELRAGATTGQVSLASHSEFLHWSWKRC